MSPTECADFQQLRDALEPWQRELLVSDRAFYSVEIVNTGGLKSTEPGRNLMREFLEAADLEGGVSNR